tara:strand:+ start:17048 stop:17245 length:198 start_codon:yes stop_codon:yes gene_type:complete
MAIIGLLYTIVGIILLCFFGWFVICLDNFFNGKSNTVNPQENFTLAQHEESFINGMIWADVGNDL